MKSFRSRIPVCALLIFLGTLLASCSERPDGDVASKSPPDEVEQQGAPSDWKRFEDPYYGFEFDYPGHWEVALEDFHRLAAMENDDLVVIAEATVVSPIPEEARDRATTNVLSQTLGEMGIKDEKPSEVPAGVAQALGAAGKMDDGRWAWVRVTTHGDIMYRIRVICANAYRSDSEGTARKIMESFRITDEVRIAGSPYGQEVLGRPVSYRPIPPGWQVQENKFGFRFAHPQDWALTPRSRENGYDYEADGIAFSCLAAANYIQEPGGMQLRRTLRQAFMSELPANSKLSEEPIIGDAGIVSSMAGHGTLPNGKGRFWLVVAVQRDLWYLMHLRCTSDCENISPIAGKIIETFQVTERLTQSDFMKRLIDRPTPWEER